MLRGTLLQFLIVSEFIDRRAVFGSLFEPSIRPIIPPLKVDCLSPQA